MPIHKQEFEDGKVHSKVEEEIIFFLKERKERAFTSQEVMEGIRYHTEFSTPEIIKMSTFAVADFTNFLYHMVEREKIKMKIVRGRMYFMAIGENVGRCPKCGGDFVAKKTWKMTGRPNKKGERQQLHIGLFKCQKHGFFRAVLDKHKITTRPLKEKIKKKKAPSKPTKKKKASKKKVRRKKTQPWILV